MKYNSILDSLDSLSDELKSLYTKNALGKYELTGFEGIKTQADIDRLKSSLDNERQSHAENKSALESYKKLGDNVEDIQAKLDRIAELEAANADKIDDEKINQIVEGRLNTKIAPVQRDLTDTLKKLSDAESLIENYKATDIKRKITDSVTKAARESKLIDTAIEDAVLLANSVFQVDETGNVVTKDGVGVTAGVDPAVWFTDMQSKRPHWWKNNQGGGASGSGTNSGFSDNPWAKGSNNLTKQGQIMRENPELAVQMQKAAGIK